MERLVFLIGPRGSGKTTVARLLAERRGWAWLDADALIEERADMSIRDIFAAEGEPGFRERESAVLRELCTLTDHVIATGGGVVLRDENRAAMQAAGVSVYLSAEVDTLWRRICEDTTTAARRPALAGGGRDEVAQILAAREGRYRELARIVVETGDKTPEQVAEEIARRL